MRSKKLGLLLAVAALVGCEDGFKGDQREEKHCVGDDGKFAPDDMLCEAADGGPDGGASGTWVEDKSHPDGGYYPAYYPHYHYVYVPYGYYRGPGTEARAFMGSTSPGSGRAVLSGSSSSSSSSAVARGGFGSIGAAHGGGGGAGE